MLKRIILFLIASLLPAGLALAQETTAFKAPMYVKSELGKYRSEASFKLKPRSYSEGYVRIHGRPVSDFLIPILLSTLSKERFRELQPYGLRINLHFNGIEKYLAYVSFRYEQGTKVLDALLTNEEMNAIEKACKKLEFEYDFWFTNELDDFTELSCYISFKDFKIKRHKVIYTNYFFGEP
ncbi:hypothetical protein [Prevotella sp. KH2C16]|uniref:hypothetical protein n=1 Tax=Prevotella sp. KH2C16 TaxID=1855325 RepID=UPI0008E1C90C|nr:hypothetical protein [Prevotella sp. KH2C16]SFG72709.1 hypothetical protein SAMN05216383_1341 [Prevotella sp. KH2C16]